MNTPATLRELYRARLPAHIEALRTALQLATGGSEQGWEALRRLAHDLKGTGGSFGFPEITDAARAIGESEGPDLAAVRHLLEVTIRCATAGPGLPRTILVVGKDPEVASLVTETLAAPGRRILFVDSSAEAAATLAQESVDLVLLDLVLPDEDGRKLLSRLRRMSQTSHLPLLVVASASGPETEMECYALGADGFFRKPLDAAVIGAVVTTRLARTEEPTPRASAPVAVPVPEGTSSTGRPCDVLLVEDDELTVDILRHRLEREGFRVRSSSDGIEALRLAAAGPPSLVILDVKLPGLDGFSVLARLRGMDGWAKVPIIMLTALGAEADLVKAFSLGATDYVLKPFSPAEVTARVRRLLTS